MNDRNQGADLEKRAPDDTNGNGTDAGSESTLQKENEGGEESADQGE